MASASDLTTRSFSTGTFGRREVAEFPVTFAAAGDIIGTVHNAGRLPAGIRPIDWHILVTDAATASVTANIGLKSVSGTNQDDSVYFYSVVALSALALLRKVNQKLPITLQQDMYLQIVIAGANIAEVAALTFVLEYQIVGTS